MDLKQKVTERKSEILKTWRRAVLAVPPGGSAGFQEKQSVLVAAFGCTVDQGIESLFDALLRGVMTENSARFLDGMVRIRAASDFTPSQTVGFIVALKQTVRKVLGNGILRNQQWREQLAAWDAAVDDTALFAFKSVHGKQRDRSRAQGE